MMKNKISIITMSMGSGGAEKVISLLLKKMINDYEVHLFLFYNKIHYPIPKEVHVTYVYNDSNNSFFDKITSPFIVFKKYLKYLEINNIDTSISFLFRPNIVNGYIKKRIPNIKVVMSERNFPSKEYGSSIARKNISKFFIKKIYNKADILFSNSKYINQDLEDNFGVMIDKYIIYNPITLPKDILNQTVVPIDKKIKIVTVGRFEPVKNHFLLLNLFKQQFDFNLTIIGDGRLRKEYEKFILESKIDNKIFLPGSSKTVLKDLLNYDIFVLSSNSEGFPNVLLEAMSVGLPVIATNCLSGPLELLNNGKKISFINKGDFYKAKYGILINVNDIVALKKALLFLSNNPNEYLYFSQKSLNRSNDFNLPVIYKQFINLLNEK
ncbi:glycosyltransferase [Tenacibaculum aestuariivivum]|uniref:glycosyltransferase n=1 Tax=Tenacibaculum aestuariivivum TaxID=2006131 RepID=UPI003AB5ECE7